MVTEIHYWAPKVGRKGEFPDRFRTIAKSPFSPHTLLAPSLVVTVPLFAIAAIETGYGRGTDWTNFLNFPVAQQAALGTFLARRLEWILSSVEFQAGQVIPCSFARLIETSEWGSLSYYLGQIGARLGAEVWLSGRVKRALHYGIYTGDAYVKIGAKIEAVNKADVKKTPDLLVEDSAKEWHVFEAKGGAATYRKKAVNDGLKQLDSVLAVGPSGFCTKPKSMVCAFTAVRRPRVTASRPLQIDLIDPPAEGEGFALHINPDVSHLSAILLDMLLLRGLPRARSPFQRMPLETNIRAMASGRIYAFLFDDPDWEARARAALLAYRSILKRFNRHVDTHPKSWLNDSTSIATVATILLPQTVRTTFPTEAKLALEKMTSDKSLLADRSGFGLAVAGALAMPDLLAKLESETAAQRMAVIQALGEENWDIAAARSGCILASKKRIAPSADTRSQV